MPGGVCAVLDYEVELMAEYIADMSSRLAIGSQIPQAPFKKFINQILSSTRLPSTTILLGMNYLSKRMTLMKMKGGANALKMSEGQVWRMVTVALLLGSKFLDDNTFQNRSWAEVSGIAVGELNAMEFEWLSSIEWALYVDLDRSNDYNAWLKSWKDWAENKKRQQQAIVNRERLTSLAQIDTDVIPARSSSAYSPWRQQQIAEFERYERMQRNEPVQQSFRPRDPTWNPYQSQQSQSQVQQWARGPVTPPDSGYGTPDYLNSAASMNSQYNDWFASQAQQHSRAFTGNYGSQPQYQAPSRQNSFHGRTPSTYGSYNYYGQHSIWESHNGADCNCMSCVNSVNKQHAPQQPQQQQQFFGMSHGYGQPVMG